MHRLARIGISAKDAPRESGLKMVYNRETGQDISEDKEGFKHEGVDSDEEEDVEESSDEENDKS